MKKRKLLKRIMCILLASCLLVISPVSRVFDTQGIEQVEARGGNFFFGPSLLYNIGLQLGYEIIAPHCENLAEEFINYLYDQVDHDKVEEVATILRARDKVTTLIRIELIRIIYDKLSSFLNSKVTETKTVNSATSSASSTIQYSKRDLEFSGYDMLPQTYASFQLSYYINQMPSFQKYYFAICSEENGVYYLAGNARCKSASYDLGGGEVYTYDHYSAYDETYVMFDDGVKLVAIDSSGFIYKVSDVLFDVYEVDENTGELKSTGNSVMGYANGVIDALVNEQLFATNYCSIPWVTIDSDSAVGMQFQSLNAYVDSSFPKPFESASDVYRYSVADTTVIDKIYNRGYDVPVDTLMDLGEVYTEVLDKEVVVSEDGYIFYPDSIDQEIIDNVYPKVDSIINENDKIYDIPVDDSLTDGTVTDGTITGEETKGFWKSLWDWLSRILQALLDIIASLNPLSLISNIVDLLSNIFQYIKNLYTYITGWDIGLVPYLVGSLGTMLYDLFNELFIPTYEDIETILGFFGGNFGWIGDVVAYVKTMQTQLSYGWTNYNLPNGTLNFKKAGDPRFRSIGSVSFFDFSWYEPYKPTGDALISAFLWFIFMWRLFRKIPDIFTGAGSVVESSAVYNNAMEKKNGKRKKGE